MREYLHEFFKDFSYDQEDADYLLQVYDRVMANDEARAFDMERHESYGIPHDVGWAPCCIETGWTMGEILMGLRFMQVVKRQIAQGT